MSNSHVGQLQIPDLQAGTDFLTNLPMADSSVAEQRLGLFLDVLLDKPLSGRDLFLLIEQVRSRFSTIEGQMACRYHGRPVPLADEEEQAFQRIIHIWSKLEQAYALSMQLSLPDPDSPNFVRQTATLLHRCIYCRGLIILEHYRARRELPIGSWLTLHAYYAHAEKLGVATAPVLDELASNLLSSHCTAAYVALLLIEIASPYSHSVRDMNVIRSWAALWAPLVSVHSLEDDEELPSYFVELSKDVALHQVGTQVDPGEDARCLDTTRLGLQINHVLGQLHMQIKPSQLGLGEETSSLVLRLLGRLIRPWTQSASPRKFRRFPATGMARVAFGFEAMYTHVGQKVFEQPERTQSFSQEDFDRLFTFGERVDSGEQPPVEPTAGFPLDEWLVINHSASGFRLARSGAGGRVSHAQLMAVLPHDGESFLLCRVSWLMQEADAGLMAGFAVLPGLPMAVACRHAGSADRFVPAFLLPSKPACKEEGFLVVSPGMYLPRKVMDVHLNDEKLQLRMLDVIERGSDYERISYEPA